MTPDILTLDSLDDPRAGEAAATLERGGVVLLPNLPFALSEEESAFLDPAIFSGESKNISLDPATGRIGGTKLEGPALEALKAMIARYSVRAQAVLAALTPGYGSALQLRRTSFRPGPVDTRVMSKRKDDRRLHVDAFPANPVQGRRILRVFTNVNPHGESRHWEVGEPFDDFVAGFKDRLKPRAGGAWREAVGLTKGRRTAYDSAMLQLHDGAKDDDEWQASAPRAGISFPPGSTWVVFTDGVLHAALAGQHAFEQTFLLPPEAMTDPARAPVAVLERLLQRPLL
jgi:hypothetical protein